MDKVLAILCSDLHLSHEPPSARLEKDWYEAMARPLKVLFDISTKNDNCPIICAGDIFHRWNSVPQLVNWAMENLPRPFYAVPGQHDLPYHRLQEVKKSAYYTLVKSGVIEDLRDGPKLVKVGKEVLCLYGVPWGCSLENVQTKKPKELLKGIHVMVVHRYFWKNGFGYVGSPEESEVSRFESIFGGYDLVVAGDNHIPFSVELGDCLFWNCGCLLRRSVSEREYPIRVGLLMSDGSVLEHRIEVEENWVSEGEISSGGKVSFEEGLGEFLADLERLELETVDFCEIVYRGIEGMGLRDSVKSLILEVLEEARNG